MQDYHAITKKFFAAYDKHDARFQRCYHSIEEMGRC